MIILTLIYFCFRSFIPKFINTIYKCKPLSTVGAEQVLIKQNIWIWREIPLNNVLWDFVNDYKPTIQEYTFSLPHRFIMFRADSRFVPSQWEMVLLCNYVSHWLGASLESALMLNSVSANMMGDSLKGQLCWNPNIIICKRYYFFFFFQLLLDTHSLKTVLLDLPSLGSQVFRKAPAR